MEEDIKKEIVSEVKSNLEEFKSSLKERIKLPVLVTYCIILVLYNWDILFYLLFENTTALNKIEFVKHNFSNIWYNRYLVPLALACLSTFIFPVFQVGINFLFAFVKKKEIDRLFISEIDTAEKDKKILDIITGNKHRNELQNIINENKNIINKQKLDTVEIIRNFEMKIEDLNVSIDEINKNVNTLSSSITHFIKDGFDYYFKIDDIKKFHDFYVLLSQDEKDCLDEVFDYLDIDVKISLYKLQNRLIFSVGEFKLSEMFFHLKDFGMIEDDLFFKEKIILITEKGKQMFDLYKIIKSSF